MRPGRKACRPALRRGATRRHPAALSGPLGDAAPAALAVLGVALLGVALLGVARTLPVPGVLAPAARGAHVVVVVEGGAGEQQVGKRCPLVGAGGAQIAGGRCLCGQRRSPGDGQCGQDRCEECSHGYLRRFL